MDLLGKGEYVWYPNSLPRARQKSSTIEDLLEMLDKLWEERLEHRRDLMEVIPNVIDKAFSLGSKLKELL